MPRIVDWYMDGKINIDDLITDIIPLDKINDGLPQHARGQGHPHRGAVLMAAAPEKTGSNFCFGGDNTFYKHESPTIGGR